MAKEEEKMELGEAIINCLPRQIKLNVTIRIYDLANLVKAAMIYTMRNIVMKNVEVILRNMKKYNLFWLFYSGAVLLTAKYLLFR